MPDFDMPAVGTWEQRGGWVVRALMSDLGLTIDQAAGVVGNLGYESKGLTDLQEDAPSVPGSAGGTGWAQWTGMHPPNGRRYLFENWCHEHGLSPTSDEANYGFMLAELRGSFKGFTARLRLALDIEEACHLTHQLYEISSDVTDRSYRSGPDRLKWAQRALAGAQRQPGGTEAPVPVPAPVQPPAPPTAASDAGVQAIQLGLRLTGDYDGAIDGIWGKGSAAGLDAFRERMRG